jgi:hypothetical protein
MEMRTGGLRVATALVLIALVAFLTGGAYAAGYAEGANHVGTVSPWVYGGFGASHVIGFIIGIFVLFLILRVVFMGAMGHRHGPWGYGAWGHRRWGYDRPGNTAPGDWQQGPWQDPAQAMFDDFHRRSHETPNQPADPNQPSSGQR